MRKLIPLLVVLAACAVAVSATQEPPAPHANLAFPDLLTEHRRAMADVFEAFNNNTVLLEFLEGDEETGEHITFYWNQGRYRKEYSWVGLTEVFGFDGSVQWHGSDYNLPRRLDNGDAADISTQLVSYLGYLAPEYAQYLGPPVGEVPLDVEEHYYLLRFAPPDMTECLILIDPLDYTLAGMLLGNDHQLDKSVLFVITNFEDWADFGDATYAAVVRISRMTPDGECVRERRITTQRLQFIDSLPDEQYSIETAPTAPVPELPSVPYEVPFSFLNDKVVIRCLAPGGKRLRLELDTGANVGLLRQDTAEDLGLDLRNHGQITGHGGAADVQFVRVEGIRFEGSDRKYGVDLPPWPAAVILEDDSMDNMLADNGVNGLLGNFLLHSFVVKIDYRRRVMSLYPPDEFDPDVHLGEDYHAVPVTRARMPYAQVTVDDKISGGAFFNTGAHHFFTLHAWAIDDAGMLYKIDAMTEGITIHGRTIFGVIKPGKVEMGDITIEEPQTHLEVLAPGEPPNRNEIASFGNAFFQRYTVTFDLFHEVFYIEGV